MNCAIIHNSDNFTSNGSDSESFDDILLRPLVSVDFADDSVTELHDVFRFQSLDNDLGNVRRTDVKSCVESVTNVANHWSSGNEATQLWYNALDAVAGSIRDQAINHNCGMVHDTVANGKIYYEYHATGRNCDNTADQFTVRGSLDKVFRKYIISESWKIYCLELTHGGTWTGYLLIGPRSAWPNGRLSCGSTNSGMCVSGGVNDAHY